MIKYLPMKIPVLTYHATNIFGNEYHTNDHLALTQDLNIILKHNITIISAHNLVNWIKGDCQLDESKQYVVLTFDDGSELDFTDWTHPTCKFQQSFYTILKNHKDRSNTYVHATSFVIASNKARKILEETCLGGYPMWGDEWWQKAEDSQLLSIENHSWDHVHPTLDEVKQINNLKGDFSQINSLEDAHRQIALSSQYIDSQIKNKRTILFAYPYGDTNTYLTEEYFPHSQTDIIGAFTCEPKHASQTSHAWKIPRYVCGSDWKSPEELESILLTI